MTKPLSIGLTGGIGSGKSVVADFFSLLGVPVYTSDAEAKKLMQTDITIRESLIEVFGDSVYSESGELNRAELANIIFNDDEALKKVNTIVHPQVRLHYQAWLKEQGQVPYVIQESAILFDTGLYKNFDRIITVTADPEIRIQRVMLRDKCTRQSVLERMSKQVSEQTKIDLSDFVIYNNSELIIPQIISIHEQLSCL
ncbi:dephospho-CoA kinase [Ancylomarina salipaludis]|uniref:Dephospho-CoA kinase n=1 Tax=Ancylomarina salipaludis TaxID=2501299 RepID=A0A4Q1JL34_9BACT|nr:dephospho-CoA kinase [Ancylomarina salipaludis]RXQ94418.1 dephospho-CoA kinase [Ancylomarina salipaludis]